MFMEGCVGGNQESTDKSTFIWVYMLSAVYVLSGKFYKEPVQSYVTEHDFKVGNKVLDNFPLSLCRNICIKYQYKNNLKRLVRKREKLG